MNKHVPAIISIFLLFFIVACNGMNQQNIVSSSEITEREDFFLSTTTEQSFVFDFHTDNSYKEVSVWVEKYESGAYVGEINRITSEIGKEGMLMFTTSKLIEENNNESLFTVSIKSEDGSATGWSPEMIDEERAVWGPNPSETIPIKGQMVLASISYVDDKNEMRTFSPDFYDEIDHHKEELKQYQSVYLFRCEFK